MASYAVITWLAWQWREYLGQQQTVTVTSTTTATTTVTTTGENNNAIETSASGFISHGVCK